MNEPTDQQYAAHDEAVNEVMQAGRRKVARELGNNELTDKDKSFISQCLLVRARHKMKKLSNGREKALHPELVRQMQEDIQECTRLAMLITPDKIRDDEESQWLREREQAGKP